MKIAIIQKYGKEFENSYLESIDSKSISVFWRMIISVYTGEVVSVNNQKSMYENFKKIFVGFKAKEIIKEIIETHQHLKWDPSI